MRKFYFLGALILSALFCNSLLAQPWMSPTYLKTSSANKMNVSNIQPPSYNFYDIQKAFNAYQQVNSAGNKKVAGANMYKRWENHWEPRAYPSGQLPATDVLIKELNQYQQAHSANKMAQTTSANWTSLGPNKTPAGTYTYTGAGSIRCIGFHPTNTNIMWIGTPDGGVWKTTNGGTSWANSNTDALPNLGVGSIAVNPVNPNILYFSTGDPDNNSTYCSGVYKSTDGGSTWALTGSLGVNGTWFQVFKLIINPTNPNILVAATNAGIFRTTDAGTTWKQSPWYWAPTGTTTANGGNFTDAAFMPGNPNVVYVVHRKSSWTDASVFVSTDGGATFPAQHKLASTIGRVSLATTVVDGNVVYAVGEDNNSHSFGGIYKSNDGGTTWTMNSNSPNLLAYETDGSGTTGQGWYTLSIAVSPSNANDIYIGGVNIWKSTDGGVNWTCMTHWAGDNNLAYVHADIHQLGFAPNTSTLYAGNDGSISKTTDAGTTWTELSNGLSITQFYRISVSEKDPSLVVGGAQDNSSFRIKSGTWTAILGTGDGMGNMIDFNDPNVMYCSTQYGHIGRSDDGGQSFSNIKPGGQEGAWVAPYAMSYQNPSTIFAGYKELYKSDDKGENWTTITNGLTGGVNLEFISVDNNANTIYVATHKKIGKTSDGGNNWSEITGTLPVAKAAISDVYTQPSNPNNVWVTFSGYTDGEKVYYSNDGGSSWTNISGTLPNIPTNCIKLDLNSTNQALYLGTDLGVFYRDNVTNDWVAFNTNLPNVIVRDLEINYSTKKLRAGTYGRGLWESPLNTGGSAPTTQPCTKLHFAIPQPTQYTVNGQGGYICGHNTYNNDQYAEYYVPNGSYTHIMGISFNFFKAVTSNPTTAKITAKIWKNDGANGAPGTVLASKDVLISQIQTDISNNSPTNVTFSTPVPANTNYYCGFQIYYTSGDTIACMISKFGVPNPNTGWLVDNNVWVDFPTSWGAGKTTSVAAYALVGNIPTTNFTASTTSGCPGAGITFTNTTTNGNSFLWRLTGSDLVTSTTMSPTATYATAGTYSVTLVAYGSCNGKDSIVKTNYIKIGAPAVTSAVTNVTCNGGSNGAIALTANGTYTYSWSNGATTKDISNLSAGNYTVTISGSGGCNAKNTIAVSQPVALTGSTINTDINCNGQNTGAVNLTSSGGTSPYTYSWNNGATTEDINNLTAGTFTVNITDAKGCKATSSATLNQPALLTASIIGKTDAACGSSNGTINLTVSGGTTPYTYKWSNGAIVEDLTGLAAGAYSVTITDAKGCTANANATITQPSALNVIVASQTNVSCNGGTNGAINITVTGGGTPYTYLWSNGKTTQNVTGLTAGVYSVKVTDAGGCSYTMNATITEPATLAASVASTTNVNCNGGNNAAVVINVSGGTTPYTYSWNNGATTKDISNLTSGNYTVTVTDAKACKSTATAAITQPLVLASSVKSITAISCNGGSTGAVSITVDGGTMPYTYLWSNGAITQNINNLKAGSYTVTVTDAKACNSVTTANVTQSSSLAVALASQTNINCNGGSDGAVNISVSGGATPYAYSWSNNATTQNISNLIVGPYSVTVTDAKGCKGILTANITQPDQLAATIVSQTNSSCNGGSNGVISIAVTGGTSPYTYSWSNGATTKDVTGLAPGTYTVTVTSTGGCKATASATITQPTSLAVTLNTKTNVSCNGGNDGTVNINVSGGTAPYTFAWNNGATTQNISNLSAGNYNVMVSSKDGCSAAFNASLTQPSSLISSITNTTNATCGTTNGAITLAASGGTTPYTFSWSNGATTQNISSLSAGNYTATVTDAKGCKSVSTASVTQPSSLNAVIASQTNVSCNGGNNGAINLTVTGGTPSYTFSWSNAATTQNLTALTAGIYSVTISDAGGCSFKTSATITQPTVLAAIIATQVDASCSGNADGSLSLAVSGGTTPYTYNWSNSATTQDISGLTSGSYSVVVTDAKGCKDTSVHATIAQSSTMVVSVDSQTNVSCNGNSNGDVTISVTGGDAPYTYSWDTPAEDITETATDLEAGTYTVTVTDDNGCVTTKDVTITQPAILIASIANTTNANCNTNGNGSIDIAVSGGTVPYTYSWSTGTTTQNLQNLSAGTYTVTVTDTFGCETAASASITLPASANVSLANKKDVSCKGGSNGTINVDVTGGILPYTYKWSNGATTQDLTGLKAGTYTLTVTSGGGCSQSLTAAIAEPATMTASIASQTNVLCNAGNSGSATLSVTGGTAPYTYSWSNAATTKDIANLSAGTYNVTVTGIGGCTATATATITQPSAIVLTTTPTNAVCGNNNGAITLAVSGGNNASYTYAWSNNATTQSITGLSAGTYTVNVTDASGCKATKSASVTQPSSLAATVAATNVSCNGGNNGSASLTTSGGTSPYTYLWSNAATTQNISNLTAGTYSVKISDAAGCSFVTSAAITQPTVLTSTVTVATAISCNGGKNGVLNLNVTGGTASYTYLWSTGATTQNISGLSAGTYSVAITDAKGCKSNISTTLTEPTPLAASIVSTINVSCNGGNNGSATLTTSGGTTPYTYNWTNGATTQNQTKLPAGDYTVTVTDAKGCTATATATLTQPTAISASVKTKTDVSCNGGKNGAITINASGGVTPYIYGWNTGVETQDIASLPAGTYTVTVTDASGCQKATTATINQPTAIAITTTQTNVNCNGGSTGSASLTVSGGTAPYTYLWSNGATTTTINNLQSTIYNVTVTDSNKCTKTATASITQPAAVSVTLNNKKNVSCNGGKDGFIDISVNGGTAPYSYLWSNAAITQDIGNLVTGTYSVTVTDAKGCTGTGSFNITQPAAMNVSVAGQTNATCGSNNGTVTITVSGGNTPYTYAWSNGATVQNPIGLAAGTYSVTVTSAEGCTATTTATITQPGTLAASVASKTNVSCNGNANGSITMNVSGGTSPYTYLWTNGVTTKDITGLAAGTYSITVTDAVNCKYVSTTTITQPNPLTAIIAVTTPVQCSGKNNGVLNATVSGGTVPYTYAWSNNATTQSISGLTAGNYSVVITDSNACKSNASYNLVNPAPLNASISSTNVSCNNGTNGSANALVNGGITPYTYSWSNGATTKDISGLAIGTYKITVTDAKGCTDTASVVITQPAAINIANTTTNVSTNGGNNGAITITVSGGTSPYMYLWSNGVQTQNLASLPAGSYTVNVTDAKGCTKATTLAVTQPTAVSYCSGTTNLTTATSTFNDGSGTNLYSTNANCKWLIKPANATSITLKFTSFRTQLNKDVVKVFDGADTSAKLLGTFSGSNLPSPVMSSGGKIFVQFITDGSGNDSGWVASYTSQAPPSAYCGGTTTLTAATDSFSDGSGASQYLTNSDCKWLIKPTGATSVTLKFTALDIEDGYDYVTVYDGADTSAPMLAWFTGNTLPDSITSSGGSMLVWFTSDYATNANGWNARYTSSSTPNNFCTGKTTLTAADSSFGDGSGAKNYGPKSDCSWLIKPTGATSITLSFANFATEYGYDFVDVYDGADTTATLLASFTGNTLPSDVTSSGGQMFVHFTSDYMVQEAGWYASYTSSTATKTVYCNSTTTLTDSSGKFNDGSGNNDYNENSNCSWLIQPTGATMVTLNFSVFDVEDGYDFVYVYDGIDSTATLLAALTGSALPTSITGVSGSLFVQFVSDYLVNATGWEASYTSSTGTVSYCTGTTTLTADSGTFSDGSGANDYFDNADCNWLIQPANGGTITLDFTALATEDGYDYVYVYDGADTTASLLGSFTGYTLPTSVTSTGSSMLVHFVSDTSTTDAGWMANYTTTFVAAVPSCSGTTTLITASGTFDDGSGTSDYVENSQCKWLIKPTGATSVTLNFTAFDVEDGYDYVYVYDGSDTNATLLGAFTGNTLPASVTSTGGSMLLEFVSDYTTNAAGWSASYTSSNAPVPYCNGTTVLTTSSGSLNDGSGTSNYIENSACGWLIQPTGAASIALTFSAFATENGKDFVNVYDGIDTTGTLLGSFSGTQLPTATTAFSGSMFVYFTSNAATNASGWSAAYTSSTTLPAYCSGTTTLTALSGTFSDGSSAADYQVNTDCAWLIKPTGMTLVTLTFTAFDVENGWDFVTVYDGADTLATVLGKFTGNTLPGTVNSGGSMLVRFTSDSMLNAAGWTADYTSSFTTTVAEVSNDKFIQVIPNPTNGNFVYSLASKEKVKVVAELYNMLGQCIWKKETKDVKGEFSQAVDISEFPAGIYNLHITMDKNVVVKKVMKQE